MSVNRFTNLRSREYVNSYVPLPINLMYQGLANKQKEFDTNIDDVRATQELIKINADPHREGIRDQLLQKYNNEINTLTDEYLKGGDTSIMSKVNRLKRDFANDQTRLGLEKSAADYKLYQADIKKNKDESSYSGIKGYDAYKYDNPFDEEGNFKSFNYEGQRAKQDYRTPAQSLMAGIADDKTAYNGIKINKSTNMPDVGVYGQYWKTSSSKEGVSRPKVLDIAEKNAENLLKDPKAGVWFIDEAINEVAPGTGHVEYDNLSQEAKDYVKKKATDYMFSLGAKQIGLSTSYGNDLNFLPEWVGTEDPNQPNVSTTWAPSGTENNNIKVAGVNISDIVTNDPTTGKAIVDWAKFAENKDMWVPLMGHASIEEIDEMNKNPTKFKEEFAKQAGKIAKANNIKDDKGNYSLEKTILFLQNVNTSANSVLMPTNETSVKFTDKMITQFDKDQMRGIQDKKSFNEVKEGGSYADKDINFQGIDFSDKTRPRLKFQFSKEGEKSTYESFTIPNNTYNEAFKPLSELVNSTHEKIVDPSKRDDIQVTTARASLGHALSLQPNILKVMKVDKFDDLNPLGATMIGGNEVYTFTNNKGEISALVWNDSSKSYEAYPSVTDVVDNEFGRIMNTPNMRNEQNEAGKIIEYKDK